MLDNFEQKIVDYVEKFGWFGLSVAPRTDSGDPEEWFTYTIGLPKSHDWPELICFGLGSQAAGCNGMIKSLLIANRGENCVLQR